MASTKSCSDTLPSPVGEGQDEGGVEGSETGIDEAQIGPDVRRRTIDIEAGQQLADVDGRQLAFAASERQHHAPQRRHIALAAREKLLVQLQRCGHFVCACVCVQMRQVKLNGWLR